MEGGVVVLEPCGRERSQEKKETTTGPCPAACGQADRDSVWRTWRTFETYSGDGNAGPTGTGAGREVREEAEQAGADSIRGHEHGPEKGLTDGVGARILYLVHVGAFVG